MLWVSSLMGLVFWGHSVEEPQREAIVSRLEQSAGEWEGVKIEWTRSFQPTSDSSEVRALIDPQGFRGPSLFLDETVDWVFADGRFRLMRAHYEDFIGPDGEFSGETEQVWREIAFDGKNLFFGFPNHLVDEANYDRLLIEKAKSYRESTPQGELYPHSYFRTIGYELPQHCRDLCLEPSTSWLASRMNETCAIDQGQDSGTLWVTVSENCETTHCRLDPQRGYAIDRIEERDFMGRLKRRTVMSEFEAVNPRLSLPLSVHTEIYFVESMDEPHEEPIAKESYRVRAWEKGTPQAHRFAVVYDRPGSRIHDLRDIHDDRSNERECFFIYPANESQMLEKCETIMATISPGSGGGIARRMMWGASVMGVVILAWLQKRRFSRQTGLS